MQSKLLFSEGKPENKNILQSFSSFETEAEIKRRTDVVNNFEVKSDSLKINELN